MKILHSCLILFTAFLSAQQIPESYIQIRARYEKLPTNDMRAIPSVNRYIKKSKNEKNWKRLAQGYRDAVQYSADVSTKMRYADSTIIIAKRTDDNTLISNAYLGKGILYYFSLRNYKQALDQYLIAGKFAAATDDEYLKNKILYHIGVVKSYMGNYLEAAEFFQDCIVYNRRQLTPETHPNIIYNSKKALLNSMHQLTVCYTKLKKYDEAEKLIEEGLTLSAEDPDFLLEHAYFNKCRGVSEFTKKNYNSALWHLKKAIPAINERNDFAWLSVVYFYIGEVYRNSSDIPTSILYYQKIDSIYSRHDFILPEVSSAYEVLITNYEKTHQENKALYYAAQLRKADKSMQRNFEYLISKISRDYDRENLIKEKEQSRKIYRWIRWAAVIVITLLLIMTATMMLWRKRQKKILEKYTMLKAKIASQEMMESEKNHADNDAAERKSRLSEKHYAELSEKLKNFEQQKLFKTKGLTVDSVAKKMGTNETYLSVFINDSKKVKFPRYIDELRIKEIISMIDQDRKFLNFKMTGLADVVGYTNRQKFTKAFSEITGLKPSEYIALRLKENNEESTED